MSFAISAVRICGTEDTRARVTAESPTGTANDAQVCPTTAIRIPESLRLQQDTIRRLRQVIATDEDVANRSTSRPLAPLETTKEHKSYRRDLAHSTIATSVQTTVTRLLGIVAATSRLRVRKSIQTTSPGSTILLAAAPPTRVPVRYLQMASDLASAHPPALSSLLT